MYSQDGSYVANSNNPDSRTDPAIAQLVNGNVVVAWISRNGDGSSSSVKAAILTPDGATVGIEFQVNTLTNDNQEHPTVAALPSGNFLVIWTSYATSGNGGEVKAQIYSPAGATVGGEFTVNTTTPGHQVAPVVTVLDDGRFVIAYESAGNAIRARIFDAAGAPLGADFAVQTTVGNPQPPIHAYFFSLTSITDLAGGGFVISWTEAREIIEPPELPPGHFHRDAKARVFGADGLPIGGEFLLSAGDANATERPSVVALSSGGFAAVWEVDTFPGRINGRIFDALGNPAAPEFQLVAQGHLLRVTPLLQGGFLVTLQQGTQAYLQAFDESGAAVGMRLPIAWNPSLTDDSIVALADGRLLDASGGANLVVHKLVPPTTLTGGPGDDVFIVKNPGDVIHEAPGQGYDVAYSAYDYRLAEDADVEGLAPLDFSSTAALSFTGNGLANHIIGNAGANRIDGGAGNDVLEGRGGNDTYVVDSAGDAVVEAAGQGYDVVYTSISYALDNSNEVEGLATLDWDGTAPIDLTGNNLANYMIGNAGVNRIDGGGGNDVMYGKGGNDTYIVDSAGDQVFENSREGYDVVYTSVSYSLAGISSVEGLSTLHWNGTAAINLTGNNGNNYLIGNAGANTLNGGAGADVMYGKGGDDIYYADGLGDQVFELAGEGYDVVYTTQSHALVAGSAVEGLSALNWNDTTGMNLTGNELANYIIANVGANTLDGKGGADVLYGKAGIDFFAFTTALGAGNVDHIGDFVANTDKIFLDDAIFTGLDLGPLQSSAFAIGGQAAEADDRIIYNQATGEIFFDADGTGSGLAMLFAIVDGAPILTANDFRVI